MPYPPEQPAHPEKPPEYYGATLYYPNCPIFQGPFQRLSRTTQAFLNEVLAVELENHARLHRAGKSTMCSPRGELNDIYRLPDAQGKRRLQWLVGETFTTTWDDETCAYQMVIKRESV